MGVSRVELVAVFLVWTGGLFLGLVHGQDWTVLSEEEAERIWAKPHVKPAVKRETNNIEEPEEQIDFSFYDYEDETDGNSSTTHEENVIEKSSRDNDEVNADPKSLHKGEEANDPKSIPDKDETTVNPESTSDKGEALIDAESPEEEATVDLDLTPPFFGPDDSDDDLYDDYDDSDESIDKTGFDFECTENSFKISLYEDEMESLRVIRSKRVLSVNGSSKSCGYVNKRIGIFIVPFKGCFTRKKKNVYSVQLLLTGGTEVRTATCFAPKVKVTQSQVAPRGEPPAQLTCPFQTSGPNEPPTGPKTGPKAWPPKSLYQVPPPPAIPPFQATTPPVWMTMPPTKPPILPPIQVPTMPPSPPPHPPILPSTTQSCPSNMNERLLCGFVGCTEEDCLNDGCCWDPYAPYNKRCFYPENECTTDGHFVFTIRYDSAAPYLLNPFSLEIPGTDCGPAILTSTFAVYIFGMDECGTVHYELGDTSVALAEVQTAVDTLNLKYATISRSPQIRFLIECRHTDGGSALASAAYMVMSSSAPVPSAVFFDGLYGIVLSIAKDETYTEFYETYHPPLRVMLNQRIYLQLELLSPVPEATIVVNYCVGYPRFNKTATIFLYEGCPNKNDPGTGIFRTIDFQGERNERRFWFDAFQFRLAKDYLDEDIYIMCSSYVCMHLLEPCPQYCFDA